MTDLIVVGGGLAGCEAAWQAARRGLKVSLYEMRPGVSTAELDRLAEDFILAKGAKPALIQRIFLPNLFAPILWVRYKETPLPVYSSMNSI